MGISNPVMAKQAKQSDKPKRGRPATGKTKVKLSASISETLLKAASAQAFKTGESLSQFVARALQTQILES